MKHRKNIVFMGSDPIGLPVLEYLSSSKHNAFCLAGIITQPDQPVGRGKKITPNAIQAWANNKGIKTLQPQKLGDSEVEWLRDQQIDLAIVIAYGQIIRQSFLDTLPLGAINLHGSLLPAYRGASPVETAVALGDKQTGVSLMKLVRKMDAGPVCDEYSVPIHNNDTALRIRKKIADASVIILEKNLTLILSNEAKFFDQNQSEVSYCRKLTKDDGWIDFNLPAECIYNRFRAFTPWPGCMCEYEGTRLKAFLSGTHHHHVKAKPGTILSLDSKGLLVATSKDAIIIESLQRPGGNMLPVSTFINGFDLPFGKQFDGYPNYPLVSDKHFARDT